MASEEFKECYGKRVEVMYKGTICWSDTAFDRRLTGDTICVGIEGILESESENFVFLRKAVPKATSVLFRKDADDPVAKASGQSDCYVNKRDILQLYVLKE